MNDDGNDDGRISDGDFIMFDFDVNDAVAAATAAFFDNVAIVLVIDDDEDDNDNNDVSVRVAAADAAAEDDDANEDANIGSNIISIDCTKAGLFNDVDKL